MLPLVAASLVLAGQLATTPSEIHIAYGNDPTTSMNVVWQTGQPTTNPVVQYGLSPNLGATTHARRSSYAYETRVISEAMLRDLEPNKTYFYRVGDAEGGWSATHSFRTAETDPKSFVFTAFGDHGLGEQAEASVAAILRERPVFHALLGDVSYANGNQPIWDQYLKLIEPLASQIPFMLTLGNHENEQLEVNGERKQIGYVSYFARFALPLPEEHYTFDMGPARFVAFNSDDYANPVQLDWLRDTLSAARKDRRVKWIVVFQHHPPFGSSKGRDNNLGEIKTVVPIFDKYKVDLVLSGHDHHYERQFPLRNNRITSRAMTNYKRGDGTLYMIQGGGGKSLYDFTEPKPEICAFREKSHGYLRVTVRKQGPLTIEAKRLDGSIMEKIEIRE
jgi:hypothetical protein